MSVNATVQKAFVVDGKIFATQKEANDYLRRPKITEALNGFIKGNDGLVTYLVENQEQIEMAFEVGTIKRVTKSESAKLEKALAAIVEANNPAFDFVAKNSEAIASSFRWPSVKRMNDDEKATAALEAVTALTDGNADLAAFIIQNKDNILEAYEAGKQKRQVSQKAIDGLAAYRAEVAAKKAAAAAE
jgi:hypothetical protein